MGPAKMRWILLAMLCFSYTFCQIPRRFPSVINLALTKPIVSTPTESSCGYPTRSTYCRSENNPNSVLLCKEEYCDQACPLRYELPPHYDLLSASNYDTCVTRDTINKATQFTSFSAHFYGQ